MGKCVIALFDTKGYMKSLSEYLGRKSFLLENRLFTQVEKLQAFLKEQKVDVLLLGQEVDLKQLSIGNHAKNIIIMSEGDQVSEGSEYPLIFKYQSAEKIFHEIFEIIDREELSTSIPKEKNLNIEFLGIYRPYGKYLPGEKFLETRISENKKRLYVNMELLSGMNLQDKEAGRCRGMSEIIFYIRQRSDKLAAKIKELTQKTEDMAYLLPVEDYRDLYSLDREDINFFLEILQRETDYEQIVFDLGYLSDTSLYLLFCCRRVYLPKAESPWEKNQLNSLEKLLLREGLEEMWNRTEFVV